MNDNVPMNLERLADLLDAYGGDVRRWPVALRAPAEALIAREPMARRLFDQALALDGLLDQAPAPLPSRALKTRLVERAAPPIWRQSLAALWPFGPAWQAAAAFAVIAALGVALGPFINQTENPSELTSSVSGEVDVLGLDGTLDEGDLS